MISLLFLEEKDDFHLESLNLKSCKVFYSMINIKPSILVVVEGKSRGNGQNEHDKSNLGVKVYSIEILQGGLIKG